MRRQQQKGFSIIEVLISFMVLTVAILALLGLMPAASKQGSEQSRQSQALYAAQGRMDKLLADNAFNANGSEALPGLAKNATVQWVTTKGPDNNTQILTVTVTWLESGRSRRVELTSMVYQ